MPERDPQYVAAGRELRWAEFAQVPAAGPDARPDPHYLRLRGRSPLPSAYMPAPMHHTRPHPPLARLVAAALIGVFLIAAFAGVCLTGW